MDSLLVSDELSPLDAFSGSASEPTTTSITYHRQFESLFPQYLAIGMTASEYWDGDSGLVVAYRDAYKLKQEQKNYEMWLQGCYTYEAIVRVSPILHAFAKKGTKPIPYLDSPIPLSDEQATKQAENKEKVQQEKIKNKMQGFAERFNSKFKRQEE